MENIKVGDLVVVNTDGKLMDEDNWFFKKSCVECGLLYSEEMKHCELRTFEVIDSKKFMSGGKEVTAYTLQDASGEIPEYHIQTEKGGGNFEFQFCEHWLQKQNR